MKNVNIHNPVTAHPSPNSTASHGNTIINKTGDTMAIIDYITVFFTYSTSNKAKYAHNLS